MSRNIKKTISLLLVVVLAVCVVPLSTQANYDNQEQSIVGAFPVESTTPPALSLTPVDSNLDITSSFTCPNFLTEVRAITGVAYPDPILVSHVEWITLLAIIPNREREITSLEGIEHFTALTFLQVPNNQLTTLDISNNTALANLIVNDNQLTTLDVSNNVALTSLSITDNPLVTLDASNNTALEFLQIIRTQITTIDVSNNTMLTNLNVSQNQLTSLDVSNNIALTRLWAVGNLLTTLDVSNNPHINILGVVGNNMNSPDDVIGWHYLFEYAGVATPPPLPDPPVFHFFPQRSEQPTGITNSFTCPNFLAVVRERVGVAYPNPILASHVEGIGSLTASNRGITSLDGIEYFTALTTLDIMDNQLATLDISNNTALTRLSVQRNQLTTLDVSNNISLEFLSVWGNQLTTLDVSNNTTLIDLQASSNQLTAIDVSNNTLLENLDIMFNQLTTLDISNNIELSRLRVHDNPLTMQTLDVSSHIALTELTFSSMTTLDVSNNTALERLIIRRSYLTELDLSNNTMLTRLEIFDVPLQILDISNSTALEFIQISGTQITTLDLSNKTALTMLDVAANQLTMLDISNSTELYFIRAFSNQLTGLDVSNNRKLEGLLVSNNWMNSPDDVIGWRYLFDEPETTDRYFEVGFAFFPQRTATTPRPRPPYEPMPTPSPTPSPAPTLTLPATSTNVGNIGVSFRRVGTQMVLNAFSSNATQIVNNTPEGGTAVFDIAGLYGHSDVRDIRIGRVPLQILGKAGLSVEFRLPMGTIILDPAAVLSIVEQSFGTTIRISITQVPHSALEPEFRNTLNSSDVVYRVEMPFLTNHYITEFGTGNVTLLFPEISSTPIVVQNLNDYIVVTPD